MSKFYGGDVGNGTLCPFGAALSALTGAVGPHASTFHGPSREGLSGECVPPDSGSASYAGEQSAPDWRYFTQHDYAELAEGF